jgi:lysophospholipase L1-like esterase
LGAVRAEPSRAAVRARGRGREVVSWVVATVLGLLVLEGAVRALRLRTQYFVVPMPSNCLQRSASLGTEFRPRCATSWPTGAGETPFRTNALGLRDAELAEDGATRILAIGDSCTWGWQVAQGDAYPQVLQRLLDERAGPGRYRVINAGTPGYTSYQGLVYLRERGLALRPAVVVFGYVFNDGIHSGDIEEALALQRRILPLVELDDMLLRFSALWRTMRTLTYRAPESRALRVPPDRFRHNLDEIVRLTREHGARPLMLDFSGNDGNNPYTRVMAELADERRVPLIVYSGPRLDIVHPTREGYVELARSVFDQLRADRAVRLPRAAD